MEKERFRVGKVYISATNPERAKNIISDAARSGEGGYVCVTNVRMVKYAGKHPDYVDLMNHSLMNLPDGTPLTWCGKLWGLKNIAVTNGPSFFQTMLKSSDSTLKHYLLGDTETVVNEIINKYINEYNSNIVGGSSLPFADIDDFDYEGIANAIKESGANIVWTAMRAPKQDVFNARISKYCPNIVFLGVGRAFRISIGDVKEASGWVKKLGIGGIVSRKKSLISTLFWYFKSCFSLAGYMSSIMYNKLKGGKSYE